MPSPCESETIKKIIADDRLICCARSRNTSLPSVKRNVRNDRGTRIRPLLSVEKKSLTSHGRKAKRSQPNLGTRIDPKVKVLKVYERTRKPVHCWSREEI
ncbi:hypothetical protein AVEN_51708-1 [Araneus ventricosus]|uniref:Uncharacterized protein n=1 Tax=Araneus ventricosus TaxID=182803 RepID=A0A4Y2GF82_ARAVE|nr:hypothetical protein AVEN_51708-1 [Araneus ventricosus]